MEIELTKSKLEDIVKWKAKLDSEFFHSMTSQFRDSLALVLSDEFQLVGGVGSVAAHSREPISNGQRRG